MKILPIALAFVINFASSLGAGTLVSQSPNGELSLHAIGNPAASIQIIEGQRVVGDPLSAESGLQIEIRDATGQVIFQRSETLPPVSALWSPNSRHVIVHGHGYRHNHSHQLFVVGSKGVEPLNMPEDLLRDVLAKDSRDPSVREWDASLDDPPFPFSKKRWLFYPTDWTVDGFLQIAVIELARDPSQSHPFQQQVCGYIIDVDLSKNMTPVRLTATSQESRSKYETIWEVNVESK